MISHSILSLLLALSVINSLQFTSVTRRAVLRSNTERYQLNSEIKKLTKFGISILVSGSFLSSPVISNAQIPSMDEYNTGSGTVLPGRKKLVGAAIPAAVIAAPEVFTVSQVKNNLMEIDKYISEEPAKWDEITREIKMIPKYNAKNLGFSSAADFGSNFKISTAQAKIAESAREDFAFNVGLLKDLALANRAYFFNKADLEQQEFIKEAAEPPSKAAVKEAKGIIEDINNTFASLSEALTPP